MRKFLLRTLEHMALVGGGAVLSVAKETDWTAAGKWGAPIGLLVGFVYSVFTRKFGNPNSGSVVK